MSNLDSNSEELHKSALMIEDEPKAEIVPHESVWSWRIKFNLWLFSSIFMFGTKMLGIGMSKLDHFWVFFFEHLFIVLTGITIFAYKNGLSLNKKLKNELSYKKDFIICATLGGISNALGNVFIIFAIHYCLASGTSPAAMNGLVMTNIILLIVVGIVGFRESHSIFQFIGSSIVVAGILGITFQYKVGGNTQEQDLSYFYFAILFTLCCSVFWGGMAIAGKYASHFYSSYMSEYSLISMIISGIFGSLSLFYVLPFSIELNPLEDDSTLFYIISGGGAGVFTTLGAYGFLRALEFGGVGIAFLLLNLQIVVEMIEELIVFQVFPTLIGGVGMILALIGASIVVLYQNPLGVH